LNPCKLKPKYKSNLGQLVYYIGQPILPPRSGMSKKVLSVSEAFVKLQCMW